MGGEGGGDGGAHLKASGVRPLNLVLALSAGVPGSLLLVESRRGVRSDLGGGGGGGGGGAAPGGGAGPPGRGALLLAGHRGVGGLAGVDALHALVTAWDRWQVETGGDMGHCQVRAGVSEGR